MKKKRERESRNFLTTRIIALGFLSAILVGTVLLMLPISTAAGEVTTPVDALFTATTSVCVTGLVVVPTYSHWTLFGQVVISLLAQVGGLGVITFTVLFFLALHRRIGLKDRLLIQAAYNLDTIQGLVILVKKIVKGTLIIEGIGALLYMTMDWRTSAFSSSEYTRTSLSGTVGVSAEYVYFSSFGSMSSRQTT